MRIAYALLVHRLPQQFGRLLRALSPSSDSGHVEFFVHVDGKAEASPFYRAVDESIKPRVHFIGRRTNVKWSGWSVVRATLLLMKAIARTSPKFDYVVLMSGQDYPIKSCAEISEYLKSNAGCEFIQRVKIPDPKWKVLNRIEKYHFHDFIGWGLDTSLKRALGGYLPEKREFPRGFVPFGGSQWWGLTSDCVESILSFCQENRPFVRFFWFTMVPDELFIHTIVANSRFSDRITNEPLTYVDWTSGPRSPKTLTMGDYHSLVSSKVLFARKFDASIDDRILDALDIHNKSPQ